MRSDSEIRKDVEEEFRWIPDIETTDLAVAVKNGVVMLTGFLRSYDEKSEVEDRAKRVAGVVGVANDIEVRLPGTDFRPDPEIVRNAVAAINVRLSIPTEHIKVVARDGWLTLEGEVECGCQRESARDAVRCLRGVRGVSNLIRLKPRSAPADIKQKIEGPFGDMFGSTRVTS